MSNLKVLAMQDGWMKGQWPAGWMNTTDYIDLYVTHMDQKWKIPWMVLVTFYLFWI